MSALRPLLRLGRSLSTSSRPLLVLGLESSADDTCAAVVSSHRQILSNIVLKQDHEQFGGIHPLLAQENHQAIMGVAISRALAEAGVGLADIDAVAFTRGPGMYGCLSVCAGAAKALSGATGLPLLGVHHMQAHALTPLLTEEVPPEFPFLTLLLSGGHTLLVLARAENKFEILAQCEDESIGASFDKACRDLRIPYALAANNSPGGALEAFADLPTTPLPRVPTSPFVLPFRNQLAFSYSGLRSALTRILAKEPVDEMTTERKRDLSRAFLASAVEQVEEKVKLALRGWDAGEEGGPLRALVLTPQEDNAAMIANVGLSRLRRGRVDKLDVMQQSKWSIEECEQDFETVSSPSNLK